jgi:hypothetical protein
MARDGSGTHASAVAASEATAGAPTVAAASEAADGGTAILVVVRDEQDVPIDGAVVFAKPMDDDSGGDGPREGRTDAGGALRLTGLAAGRYFVRATSVHHLRGKPAEVVAVADREVRCELVLVSGESISGIVLDPQGAPAAGARVSTRVAQTRRRFRGKGARAPKVVLADAEGRFVLDGLAAGTYDVTAESGSDEAGYAPALARGVDTGTDDVVLQLGRGSHVAGRVLALPDRRPVADASVFTRTAEPAGWTRSARTAGDGSFTLGGLPAGALAIVAEAPNHPPGEVEVEVPAAGGDVYVEVLLSVGGTISGHVLDATGAPKEGAIVQAKLEGRKLSSDSAEVGPDGSYAFRGLPAGVWYVYLQPTGGGGRKAVPQESSIRVVSLPDGEARVVDFTDDAGREVVEVRGRLTQGGAPVAGAGLGFMAATGGYAGQNRARTDARGAYAIELAPGRYLVYRDQKPGPGGIVAEVDVPRGVPELQLDLEVPAGSIGGRVAAPGAAHSLDGIIVTAIRTAPGGAGSQPASTGGGLSAMADIMRATGGTATTAADGTFTITGLRAGRYDLVARSEASGGGELRGIEVGSSAVGGVVIELRAGVPLVGVVRDEARSTPRAPSPSRVSSPAPTRSWHSARDALRGARWWRWARRRARRPSPSCCRGPAASARRCSTRPERPPPARACSCRRRTAASRWRP